MPNIVSLSHFSKSNELNIPLSVAVPVSNPYTATPSNENMIANLITREEKAILLNALGLNTYTTLQLALSDLDNPIYASYKKLVDGDEYDGKVWSGLSYDYSLIAYKVYEEFVTETNTRLSAVGTTKVDSQGAENTTPTYKIATANQKFILQYQGGYLNEPLVYDGGIFIDWYGANNGIFVSMYQYLVDKIADFPDWDVSNFNAICEAKNSFGI